MHVTVQVKHPLELLVPLLRPSLLLLLLMLRLVASQACCSW
jgi:hypothetical protein